MRRRAEAIAAMLCFVLMNSADAGWGHWRHGGWGWGGGLTVGYVSPWCGDCCYGPYGWGGYGTTIGLGYYPYGYPYGVNYNPAAGHLSYYLPPTSEPAELNFGPQAVKQFLGLPRDFALGGLRNADALAAAAELAARPEAGIAERGVRVSSPEARGKSARHLADGDELFRGQNFHAALQRYKLAANAAPDLAEPYWRQGHALIATHNFELAANVFKRAIALTDDLSRGGFRLDDLYANAALSKARHLESLAAWTLQREDSADPYFLLGLFLNYDGQFERAEKFFHRAADLAGFAGGHIAVFLTPIQDVPVVAAPGPIARGPSAPAPPAIAPRALPVKAGAEI